MHLTPFATSRRNPWCHAKSGCGPIVQLTDDPGLCVAVAPVLSVPQVHRYFISKGMPVQFTGGRSFGPDIHVGQRSHWPEFEVSLNS